MTDPKDSFRKRVWDELQRRKIALFPGAHGRIPNFKGAGEAARRLVETPEFRRARTLKCNPDSPQVHVRRHALKAGKTVYMAVPRLRELECFIRLDPAKIDKPNEAATIRGAFKFGVPVHPSKVERIDLVLAGSVAVNRRGHRIGKGGGYSDLEYALGREFGFLSPKTPIATTVHDLQVLPNDLPVLPHDIPVTLIATPSRLIRVRTVRRPEGVDWSLVTEAMRETIPILRGST